MAANLFRFLVTLLLCLLWGSTQAEDVVTLINDSIPPATIIIGPNASDQARQAADELQNYLRRMSGVPLAIAQNSSAATGVRIFVGTSAAQSVAENLGIKLPSGLTPQFEEEGYVVFAQDDIVLLTGNESEPYRGTLFAVYDLLESLGCRWYFPGEFGEVVPQLQTVQLPPALKSQKPQFRVRDLWYSGYTSSWQQRQPDSRLFHNRQISGISLLAAKRHRRQRLLGIRQSGTDYSAIRYPTVLLAVCYRQ